MRKGNKNKFEFGTDFQELILQYTLTDPKGFKVLELYEDTYFELLHHSVIGYAIKKYYKKYKHIPEEPYLKEFLRVQYHTDNKTFRELLPADKELISTTISKLFSSKVTEPDRILDKCVKFARWVNFKDELENVDINNFDSWETSVSKLQKAIRTGHELQEDLGVYLIKGVKDRVHKRDLTHVVTPTPFWQMNRLLNSGGTEKGNLIAILSKEKIGKTVALINVARGYLKMRKKGIYADLENGLMAIVTRAEQSTANQNQETIQSGNHDEKLMKLFRKYQRIGSELAIKRFSNLKTTMEDIQAWVDKLRQEDGYEPSFAIIDYGLLLGAISGKQDDFNRISDAFLDLKNFAEVNRLDAVWTAAHVTREGSKRLSSKFLPTDIAKCNDIPKHIDCLLGLQQSEEEMEGGVWRFEVIEGRNIKPNGKMLFWVDIDKQRMKEFTKGEVAAYRREAGEEDEDPKERMKKRKAKSDL